MEYTIDYFISKFLEIPENKWAIETQDGGSGRHCAIGWCINDSGHYGNASVRSSKELIALVNIFENANIKSVIPSFSKVGWNIADVNNGKHPDYQQTTSKERILAALNHAKLLSHDKLSIS